MFRFISFKQSRFFIDLIYVFGELWPLRKKRELFFRGLILNRGLNFPGPFSVYHHYPPAVRVGQDNEKKKSVLIHDESSIHDSSNNKSIRYGIRTSKVQKIQDTEKFVSIYFTKKKPIFVHDD